MSLAPSIRMNKSHNRNCFYKYVSAKVAKDILRNLRVKCSSPLLFNDPFDSQIEIKHDVKNKEELIKRTTGKICELIKPLLRDGNVGAAHSSVYAEIIADSNFVNEQNDSFDRFYQEANKIMLEFAKKDRIFCVSDVNDNLLMWAQYAEEHKGAVIQFKCVPEKDTALCVAKPVIYSDKMPVLTVEDLFKGEQVISEYILNEIYLTKSLDWKYEREWRVIVNQQDFNADYDLRGIFEEELAAVYLGCRMSHEDKNEIIDIIQAQRKTVKIFESLKDKHKFKLLFNEHVR